MDLTWFLWQHDYSEQEEDYFVLLLQEIVSVLSYLKNLIAGISADVADWVSWELYLICIYSKHLLRLVLRSSIGSTPGLWMAVCFFICPVETLLPVVLMLLFKKGWRQRENTDCLEKCSAGSCLIKSVYMNAHLNLWDAEFLIIYCQYFNIIFINMHASQP